MKTSLTLTLIFFGFLASGQTTNQEQLIAIGKTYSSFMFATTPDKAAIKELRSTAPEELKTTADFVAEAITSKNKLLTSSYLSLPDEPVLKQLYIVNAIHANLHAEVPIDNKKVVDSLTTISIPRYELVDNYYDLLFTACGNKNMPFNLSKIDFDLDAYNLKDETEKGIFFLTCMNYCGMMIWGYINIADPPNTKEAYNYIQRFPKFGGQLYYTYTDFFFPDFEMVIIKDEGVQNYKSYYLNKYYELLLSHGVCLIEQNASEEEMNKLLLGSILHDERLYKYTEYKETLEQIFSEVDEE